jgi:uncharacterized RDD family membrane protein YckC
MNTKACLQTPPKFPLPPGSSGPPLQPAGVFRRIAALIYDGLVVLGIAFVVTNLYLMVYHALFGLEPQALDTSLLQRTLFPSIVAATSLFFLWFWTHGGRTLGMRAWHLKLVSEDGGNIQIGQAFRRLLSAPLSLAPLGLGYWSCWIDPAGCSWHDRLSQTRMILDKSQR